MNLPTIIVALVIAGLVTAIIVSEIKKRRSGKCSCGCSECSFKDKCHNKKEP